jgi:hypothetical protein
MAEKSRFNLFGFRIGKKEEENGVSQQVQASFAPPSNEDGAFTVTSAAQFGTSAIDLDGTAKNEVELITRYREMAMQPEVESAIDDIVNEAIVHDDNGKSLEIVMDNLKQSDKIKKAIKEEFDTIIRLLNYDNMGSDIFRRYYIDGRLFYHILVDISNPQKGIQELRYIDPRKIRKVREVRKQKDPNTGMEVVTMAAEYFVYSDRVSTGPMTSSVAGVKIAPDSIININSGLMDAKRGMVLSYLHKAIKPLNQLRMIEDAVVIYRLSRAPERRVFYIDVGNLPRVKAEQYVRDVMTKYKNKLVYDAQTGEVRDDRRHLSMMEDFWMPRRSDGKSTEITTLPSGQNLGQLEDVNYFERKLYKSLNVPVTRLDPSQAVSVGRSTEITRDELKFSKFIEKLRNKFAELFDQALRVQLVLKGVCTEEEWAEFKESIYYDFIKDNNFVELKEAELMQERLGILAIIDQYSGKYYSKKWIQENILRLNDLEIEEMQKEIDEEEAEDFKKQSVDQQKQIILQQQAMELQNAANPQQEPQIDAGAEQESPEAQQGQQMSPKNPYNIRQ